MGQSSDRVASRASFFRLRARTVPLLSQRSADQTLAAAPGLHQQPWLLLFFFIVPAVIYAAIVTRFSFDPFEKAYGWHAYNHYALALSRLSHEVPADVISGEGQYFRGHAYMYYGMLPAVLRLPLIPFIDLHRLPLANLYIWAMLVGGQVALQSTALRVFVTKGGWSSPVSVVMLVLVSYAIWFSSGSFLLVHGNSFYTEPHAAATMLASIFIAMLVHDLVVEQQRAGSGRLLAYAAIAGACLFARQTFAIGLYVATIGLLMPNRQELRTNVLKAVRRAAPPLALLFAAGVAYLMLAYARTGHIGSGWEVAHYGFYVIGKNRPRLDVMIDHQFSLVRIVPNLIYVLNGGAGAREQMIAALGGGKALTFGRAVRHLLFTPFALVMACAGLVALYRRLRAGPLLQPALIATLGFGLIAMIQLAYPTMQYRYYAELWPVLAWLMLLAMLDFDPVQSFGRWHPLVAGGLVALSVVSLSYTVQLSTELARAAPSGRGSLRAPLPAELAALATAPGSRDRSVEVYRGE